MQPRMWHSMTLLGFPSTDWSGGERKRQNMPGPLPDLSPPLASSMDTWTPELPLLLPGQTVVSPQIYKNKNASHSSESKTTS